MIKLTKYLNKNIKKYIKIKEIKGFIKKNKII